MELQKCQQKLGNQKSLPIFFLIFFRSFEERERERDEEGY